MKVQSLVPDSDEDEIEEDAEGRVMNEIQILNNVLPPHKHIVELRDILLGVEKFFIVTERCASNDLVEFYPTANNTRARNIFKQLVETVQFMHDYGVVHYDLKAQNVLFDTTLMRDIKIIDFNKARYYRDLATKTYNNFNPDRYYWSDRHNFRPGDPYKQTLPDIRQLGNILYSMLAGTEVQLGVDDFYETDDLPEISRPLISSDPMPAENLPGATNATAARIFKQLATTVHFIHQHGVVHNDLKSVNVLFASAGMRDIKIIDFGISAYYETMATRTYHNFNPRSWFAEEELRQAGDGYASPFGDVEQLGNLLHCMLSGRDIDPTDWTDPEPDPEPRTDIFDDNALHLFGLIGPYEHRADPSARLPELEQILQHPWLR
ncbi:hypothetical protein AXG93_3884s1190 [Marchantia polymorpha subsp. ruderalis]|uniref:Protein kinase domain-containing protein n=1 Tax=Marchantia polymorpha subsp. ruderalis TaxID=1480154 RepID=A0A176WAK2_MARPO|nr:hypothetical protein AXG93_3884s1190 [Marchantia polymorpha subsp. ruderalis]